MKTRKVRIHRFGGPDVLQMDNVETSQPDALQLLRLGAFCGPVRESDRRAR
jgi:hypothetical protein